MPSTNSKRRNKERYRPGMNRPMPMKDPAQLPETLIATDPEPPSKQPDHSALPEPLDLELPSDIHIVWILRSIAAIAVTLLVFALYGLLGGTL